MRRIARLWANTRRRPRTPPTALAYEQRRRSLILQGLDLGSKVGLEIGPLASPVVQKHQGSIYYVDHCSLEEISQKYFGQVPAEKLQEIDFVWDNRPLSNVVQNKTFDYIVASHVIEHVPNVIGWLSEIENVLKEDGILCLAIPDKRYTFDIDRQLSTAGQLIEAYYLGRKVPSLSQVFDNYTLARKVDKDELWRGSATSIEEFEYLHPRGAVWDFMDRTSRGEYVDCHCWIFTPQSFLAALEALRSYELTKLTVTAFWDTLPYQHEFIVQLRRGMPPVPRRP
jgi:SAM-dependent methyltransferase